MIGQAALVLFGYLLGAVPFGYLAGRARGVDLRREGSGNTGGTNAIRVLGARWGVPALILDVAKGSAAVLAAEQAGGLGLAVLAGTAAVLGHTFPVFLGFGGGKGVATAAGATLALLPWLTLALLAVWIVMVLLTRYVSVASITIAVGLVVGVFALPQPWSVRGYGAFASGMVLWRHRGNVARLRAGTEHRVNLRRRPAAGT
ncbi:MAG TPA: glycerol-3-phosphate 1-O-acyltransferase PlsY [Gaiellales bacterium]|nr:glycerol-3-phosphate 1-O-acyltransferase PlsY [Gaiellales bacterium]